MIHPCIIGRSDAVRAPASQPTAKTRAELAKAVQMTALSVEQQAMVELFQRHVEAELAGDLDATMATMTDDPHLNHVPTMAGGVGRVGVQAFYRDHLVGKFFPPDVAMTNVSRTVGQDQVLDESRREAFGCRPTNRPLTERSRTTRNLVNAVAKAVVNRNAPDGNTNQINSIEQSLQRYSIR